MSPPLLALSAPRVRHVALAGLSLSSGGLAGQPPGTPLLAFGADAVERLTISDGEGESVALARKDDGWVLPQAGDFPADSAKVDALLTRLAEVEQGPPVATSDAAPARLRVAEDAFERKLVLEQTGGDPATVYLGTAQDRKSTRLNSSH